MRIVTKFGDFFGFRVQPTKRKVIFLNTAIKEEEWTGMPVLKHGDTIRDSGYHVGTGNMEAYNWALRIRNVRRRLPTAVTLATSVLLRTHLLNAILLPGILFTAAVFKLPKWAERELINLQKQFLWRHSTSVEKSRNKINPGLLHSPRKSGVVGLLSIAVAVKTQRTKHAQLWLTQKQGT
ncbi:hypothetical protein PC118_g13361 [Phytophthora cactorum]|nr:hypothetical protein PC112_g13465 [Phytophthora cactorum]KAG2826822.1 hypothetical protein PC111_g8827 [Phytophthora cactorum]KAG2854528.1 hypothetical protein PC113_g13222 [Phytophthora cactorum]KAG2882560.1 hypothetical protein PC115_g21913 [Phytophthora cactorum]KAG2976573.1 hypothetical protein PC118_g13361 [Phytophthora cactorum]